MYCCVPHDRFRGRQIAYNREDNNAFENEAENLRYSTWSTDLKSHKYCRESTDNFL